MKKLIVLLHGVGSRGADMQGLGKYWSQTLDDVIIATPDGPSPFDMGPGFQWFSVNGITDETRAARIAEARSAFNATIKGLLEKHDVQPGRDKLVLSGFSQGAIMSLDALVNARWPLAAVVAFSGRLASAQPWQPVPHTPVLLVHGASDPVINYQQSQRAAEQLGAAGVDVDTYFEPGVPHTITANGAMKAANFLLPRLNRVD